MFIYIRCMIIPGFARDSNKNKFNYKRALPGILGTLLKTFLKLSQGGHNSKMTRWTTVHRVLHTINLNRSFFGAITRTKIHLGSVAERSRK